MERLTNIKKPLGGFKAPETMQSNPDRPVLNVGEGEQSLAWEEQIVKPPTLISLDVCLKPIPLQREQTVQLRIDGQSFDAAQLYDGDRIVPDDIRQKSRLEAIELYYEGKGYFQYADNPLMHFFNGNELENGMWIQFSPQEQDQPPEFRPGSTLMYRKPFNLEKQTPFLETRTYLSDGRVFTVPPSRFNIKRNFRPHSGYYDPKCPIQDIQQVYYDLTERDEQTYVVLTRFNDLQPEMSSILLPTREEEVNLAVAIKGGGLILWVATQGNKWRYLSAGYEEDAGRPDHIRVHFKKDK